MTQKKIPRYQEGMRLFTLGEKTAAIALLQESLKSEELDDEEKDLALMRVGDCFESSERFEQALDVYELLLDHRRKSDGDEIMLMNYLGELCTKYERVERGIHYFEGALKEHDKTIECPVSLAHLQTIEKMVALLPNDTRVKKIVDERFKKVSLQAGPLQGEAKVRGTRARLRPPAHFESAALFNGFEHKAGISIVLIEFDASQDNLLELMSDPDRLRAQGMRVVGQQGSQVLSLEQQAGGVLFDKRVFVARDDWGSVIATATWPKALSRFVEDDFSECIEESLKSLALDEPEVEQDEDAFFETLDFRLPIPEGLRIARRLGETLVINESGRLAPGLKSLPAFVIGASSAPHTGGREDFALRRFGIDHPKAIHYDDDGERVHALMTVVFDEHRYWIAMLHHKGDEKMLTKIRASIDALVIG